MPFIHFSNAATGVIDDNELVFDLTVAAGARVALAALSIRTAPGTDDGPTATLDGNSPDQTLVDNLTDGSVVSVHQWVWMWFNPATGGDLEVNLSWTTDRDASAVAWTAGNAERAFSDLETDAFDDAVDADMQQTVTSRNGGMVFSVATVRTTSHGQISPAGAGGVLVDRIGSSGGASASNVTTAVQEVPGDGTDILARWALGTEQSRDSCMSSFYVGPSPWRIRETWHRRWIRRLARM